MIGECRVRGYETHSHHPMLHFMSISDCRVEFKTLSMFKLPMTTIVPSITFFPWRTHGQAIREPYVLRGSTQLLYPRKGDNEYLRQEHHPIGSTVKTKRHKKNLPLENIEEEEQAMK